MTKENAESAVGWNFDNSYARLPDMFYSKVDPTPVDSPRIIILNESLAESLGLDSESLKKNGGLAALAGNEVPTGASPLAQAYAGHQFGHFTMLGDGRAILLGEQITPSGERVDIQLKGPGRTPYSRSGDGRAALGPMLREYIMSEAMNALGISTTRSLAVVKTNNAVIREERLPLAILTRVATSHIRVGTFQYVSHWGKQEDLQVLADYTLNRHFTEALQADNRYLSLLNEVIDRQATLIANWQLVGFIHGVMNTDNMALNGETIDYGPCAFMDVYDPATVFSSIDAQGRYAYGNQPLIGEWNLARFAETILPLLHSDQSKAVEMAQDAISRFADRFHDQWLTGMRAKLGLFNEEVDDEKLIAELLDLMLNNKADYTNTFRSLTFDKSGATTLFGAPAFLRWMEKWEARRERQSETRQASLQMMKHNNPAVIPRNHRVEEVLTAAVERDDFTPLTKFLAILSNPYEHTTEQEEYTTLPPASTRPYRTYCGT
ncbi:hypothetical protein BEP19_16400 [Ammoniphilus oxalaticus]|uniref:Protein nucleotidyltransferase YdiU n=1 Tax=Ammoniphilus oxalaticus TaxID=66863 RepID=A0A419SQV7_9BACL|nr:YdiU family protein [Ammoniphilus oxalaticus]RKD26778.1 hypothetical protein BEP19_16400 [Ammoniphilus oxalaticus]